MGMLGAVLDREIVRVAPTPGEEGWVFLANKRNP
jgi:hypothetical protein